MFPPKLSLFLLSFLLSLPMMSCFHFVKSKQVGHPKNGQRKNCKHASAKMNNGLLFLALSERWCYWLLASLLMLQLLLLLRLVVFDVVVAGEKSGKEWSTSSCVLFGNRESRRTPAVPPIWVLCD